MEKGGTGFLDFFWGQPDNSFDPFDTEVWLTRSRWTRIFFLHGGIHLRRLQGGGTRKATSLGGSLLDQFETVFEDEESPLLVSEGDSDDKLLSVSTSDYLTFAHQSFVQHEGGLVVFGHSLGDADEHIVKPIRSWRENPVAVAIRPSNDPEAVIQRKAHVRGRLAPMKNILFFDSSTHPLGSPELVPRVKLFGRGR